eukprot:1219848-Pyramimonas_sp.AAC.1
MTPEVVASLAGTPDHRVRLTERGKQQARKAGETLASLVGKDGRVYFYVSPYIRTLQTLLELSAFYDSKQIAGVREDARIREQEFGNLQDERMPLSKRKRLSYGRFFFRFPDGESAADVFDRSTSFRETLRNDIEGKRFEGEDTDKLTVVIVTHGITLRVLLMRWFKLSVSQFALLVKLAQVYQRLVPYQISSLGRSFSIVLCPLRRVDDFALTPQCANSAERLKNRDNCELVVMERGVGGRFSLALHHSEEWLRDFGFDDQMLQDQVIFLPPLQIAS